MKEPNSETPAPGPEHKPRDYIVAVLAFAVALLLRECLNPWLGDYLPFPCFFLATLYVAWSCASPAPVLTLVLGLIAANWFYIPHHGFFVLKTERYLDMVAYEKNLVTCASFLFSGGAVILVCRLMHNARQRADRSTQQALQNQKLLEVEVAERKRAEDQVRQLNAELELRVAERTSELVAANADLESFTYSVSHDLRAPLRHVDGYAQILEEEYGPKLPPEALQYATKIRRGSQKMGHLVDDLLNLARVGQKDLVCQPVALNAVVNEAVAETQLETAGRKIEWCVGALPTVNADPGLMKLVFNNLITNAAKYTRPREHARIEIGQTRINGDNVIFVRDNGVGFNMRYVGKLFGVFQRLHRAEEFEGTGVGLATVARIVRKHGGKIWAEAELNKGATFFLTLEPTHKGSNPNGAKGN